MPSAAAALGNKESFVNPGIEFNSKTNTSLVGDNLKSTRPNPRELKMLNVSIPIF